MTSDVTWLETYKNIKTMHCSKTWINLHRFLDFVNACAFDHICMEKPRYKFLIIIIIIINTRILPKTCPALSWDQALLSFSWVNSFKAGKQATQ